MDPPHDINYLRLMSNYFNRLVAPAFGRSLEVFLKRFSNSVIVHNPEVRKHLVRQVWDEFSDHVKLCIKKIQYNGMARE